ncbi:ABC transporter permease [Brachybacterium alimentarium]|uniref:ABC transporter permease n=1 Tax=Brachybacterium alimentarium TaxID=47845 RepID=UPI003FD6B398
MRPVLDIRAHLDTRSAAILMAISLLLIVAFAALGGFVQPAVLEDGTSHIDFTGFVLTLPLSLIIPVITVMITAGEWSDGSIQNTFLQRPGRLGVLGSKVIAAIVVVAALLVVSFAAGALATWIGGDLIGNGAVFESLETVFTTQLASLAATLLFSLAMGLALQSTVLGLLAAIGFPFVTATATGIAAITGSETVMDIVSALDLDTAATTLADGSGGAFELIPIALLLVLPGAYGIWRWNHREVG